MFPEKDKFSRQELKDLYEEFNQIPYNGVDEESKDIFRERLSEFLADFFKDGSARNWSKRLCQDIDLKDFA